jgi:hypothetical protein
LADKRVASDGLHINDSNHLWRLLVRMTVLKAGAKGRRHHADRRDVTIELRNTGVTETGVRRLRAARPTSKIEINE